MSSDAQRRRKPVDQLGTFIDFAGGSRWYVVGWQVGVRHRERRARDMKFVVTGGAGFIGSRTVEKLVERGRGADDIVAVDCFTPYYDRRLKHAVADELRQLAGVTFIDEAISPELCDDHFEGADSVIHLAAQPGVRDSWASFDSYVEYNITATHHIMEAVLRANVPRLVYASSSSVYGNPPDFPTTEDARTVPRSPYGVTKLAGEKLVNAYALEHGISSVSLRYFTVYGPRQRPDMAFDRLIRSAFTGSSFTLFGDGSQIRDFTFIDDVVEANLLGATQPNISPGTVLNICGGGPVSLAHAIGVITEACGSMPNLDRQARPFGDVPTTTGSNERARDVLGWEPKIDLPNGIRRQVEYLRRHH